MTTVKIELKLSLNSDKPPLTELNNAANWVVIAIEDIGTIIANTFHPKLFITVEHAKNHQAYNYIYTVRILDDAQDKKMYEERYAIIEKLLESIKIVSEKPSYEDLCKDWIAKLRTLLINSNYCEDEEGAEEISSIISNLQKKLSKMYSKLKIEMIFDYHNKGAIPNRIADDNNGLFNQPNIPSGNENGQRSDNLSETEKSIPEGFGNEDKDHDHDRGMQSEQTTFEDPVVVKYVAKMNKSGQVLLIPYIEDVRANLCYNPRIGEHICDLINKQKIKIKLLIDNNTNSDGAYKVMQILESQM